jgi:tol-pal system protein YbgF
MKVMRVGISLALVCLLLPAVAPAQKRELTEMNRDVALLQEEVRSMKKADEDRFNAIDAALKQILDQINSANRQVAGLGTGLNKGVTNQIGVVGAKVDTLGEDFKYVKENVSEVIERLGKIEQKVVDLNTAIRTMQAPPAPPAETGAQGAATSGPPPGTSADSLYKDALRDKLGAKYDLALDEFRNYVSWFGDSEYAPNAQYYIGEIYYNQKKFDDALKAFDAVIAMPKNNKSPDAHFMKGRALVRLGEKSEGAREFRAVIQSSPGSDVAKRAQAELRDLGVSTSAPATKKRR